MQRIKNTVNELIEKYNTNNPFEIADFLKIHVVPWNLHEEIQGFYKYDKRNKYIFINDNLDEHNQTFVCAHELGHSQLHPRVNTPFLRGHTYFSLDKIEMEANAFAVELLLPDKKILELSDMNLSITEACKMFGIPEEVQHLKTFEPYKS